MLRGMITVTKLNLLPCLCHLFSSRNEVQGLIKIAGGEVFKSVRVSNNVSLQNSIPIFMFTSNWKIRFSSTNCHTLVIKRQTTLSRKAHFTASNLVMATDSVHDT